MAEPQALSVWLPEEAAAQTMADAGAGECYSWGLSEVRLQTLDGESALELLRYRDGYSDADLGRIKTQRAFLTALIRQTATANGLLKTPALLQIFRKQVQTDLTAANWLWLARTTLLADTVKVNSATLPGNGTYIDGVNCYVLDAELTAAMISTYSSPYKRDIAPENLQIPTK